MAGTSLQATVETKGAGKSKGMPPKVQAALEAAEGKWAAAKKRALAMKENMQDTAMCGMHVAETQGTVFATEVAAGYFGEDKLYVGGMDGPGVVGAAAGLWGLYEEATGGDGSHQLAVGNGLLATAIGRIGRRVGRKLAERGTQAPEQPPAPPAGPAVRGDDVGALRRITQTPAGSARMPMLMTPPAELPEPAAPKERKGKLLNWARRLRERESADRGE